MDVILMRMWYNEDVQIHIYIGGIMDKETKVKYIKKIIWDDIFSDVNKDQCKIDLLLENRANIKINKFSFDFFKCSLDALNKVKNSGQILFIRKYRYEKVLNDYLIQKYNIDNVKINTISIPNNKKTNDKKTKIDLEKIQESYIKQITNEHNLEVDAIKRIKTLAEKKCFFNDNKCLLFNENCSVFHTGCMRKNEFDTAIKIEEKKEEIKRKKEKNRLLNEQKQKKSKKKKTSKSNIEEMSPTEIKTKILMINNPTVGEFLKNISDQTETPMDDLIVIYERIIKQCYAHKNGICLMDKQKCNIAQEGCLHHKQFIEGIKANKKNGITIRSTKMVKKISSEYQINIKDFVVRRAVFKCTHEHHHIENVDAVISVDCDGKKTLVQIPAGYCNQCKTYFIMESTYQELKHMGVILCRITDEKNYLKSALDTGMQLAQESVLMQYGYNVSQTEGLSQKARQKILALLIDNEALSKSEIISYLDFFISQRAGRSSMELAISKWETDREFVENYRIGEYTKYGVNAIYRR